MTTYQLQSSLKEIAVPGSLAFLLFALLFGICLLFGPPHVAPWGRRLLTSIAVIYLVLSLQGTCDLLVAGLQRGYGRIHSVADARGARTIVVLGNGNVHVRLNGQGLDVLSVQSAYNILEAARVYALLGEAVVLASGGPPNAFGTEARAIERALERLGVPRGRIHREEHSTTTYAQATGIASFLRGRGEQTFVLVTTPDHMRRAVGTLNALGLDPVPSVSAINYGGPPFWQPSGYALSGSKGAIYEYLAWGLYKWRRWI